MSAASARAEARRKAILSRGSDRLAKLTTSARGEDAPAYMKDAGSSTTSRNFLGEESTHMPAPSSSSFTPSPSPSPQPQSRKVSGSGPNHSPPALNPFEAAGLGGRGMTPDPSVWSPEQQQQFMRALMGASSNTQGGTPLQSPLGDPNAPIDPNLPPMDNPLAALLFPQGLPTGANGNGVVTQGGPASMFGKAPETEQAKAPSKYQKFLPLVHILALWALLGYFVLFLEPKIYSKAVVDAFPSAGVWGRWSRLVNNSPWVVNVPKAFHVQVAPFFWAFMTMEVMLHSVHIFTGSNAVNPPALLAMFIPQLPPPLPSIIVNSLKYIKMLSMLVDDVAGLIVGLGFIIYFSGLLGK